MKCLLCKKETGNPKFCNKSCAASYNNRLTKPKLKPNCKSCGKILPRGRVYCSSSCCGEYKYRTISYPKILAGEGSTSIGSKRRFLVDRDGNLCSICGQESMWNDKPLQLQIDHKDGDRENNNPKNLRLICPNCHTQTETYSGRNINGYIVSDDVLLKALNELLSIPHALISVGLVKNGRSYRRCKNLLNKAL